MKLQKHLALLLGCSLVLSTCILPAPKASAAKIKLNKKKLTLEVKQSYTLKLKNCKKKIKWSSSKKKVASVSAKGKVKAKKAGKTTITAKVGKKKYTCKVTVKKASSTKVSPTPNSAKTPQPANTTQTPVTSSTPGVSPSTNPYPTETPKLSPEELAENVSVERTFFPEHILLTVTNNNLVWLENVIVTYEYYGMEETEIANGSEELFYLKPGESQYIAIPTVASETEDSLNTDLSLEHVEVTDSDLTGSYSDQTDKVEILEEDVDYDTASLTLTLKNHSPLDVKINYLIYFYDADDALLDVAANTIDLSGKEQFDENIDIPEQCADYQIQQYSAHSFEEMDDNAILAKGVTVFPEKLADCLLLTVTNSNGQWLSRVDIDYDFYDAEDDFLSSDIGSLLSMGPGEFQYLVIEADSSELEEIDLDYSVANISVEPAEPDMQYQYIPSSLVTASIGSDSDIADDDEYDDEEYEDDDDEYMEDVNKDSYTITFTNEAALPIDGSYTVFFRDSKGDIISARQDTLSIAASDSYSITLDIPVLYDQNDEEILLSDLQEDDIHIFAHAYTETEDSENQ